MTNTTPAGLDLSKLAARVRAAQEDKGRDAHYDFIDPETASQLVEIARHAQPRVSEQADAHYPYDALFRAIADATSVAGNAVAVSVKQFVETLNSKGYAITQQAAPEAPAHEGAHGNTTPAPWAVWEGRNVIHETEGQVCVCETTEDAALIVSLRNAASTVAPPVAAPEAPASEQQAKPAAWIDKFNNVWPLGAYSPDGKPNYHDAHKRGWDPLFRATSAATTVSVNKGQK